jgi:hypothetical protein
VPALTTSDQSLAALTDREAGTAFDLAEGRPVRAHLISTAPGEHVLLLCLHHIAFDAQSVPVLERDLGHAYARALGQPAGELPPLVQFADADPVADPDAVERLRAELRTDMQGDVLAQLEAKLREDYPVEIHAAALNRVIGQDGF